MHINKLCPHLAFLLTHQTNQKWRQAQNTS
uniref:Uncharacterized protein n=1 Tax=Rhizophora mucronata TaxID=61149 RepID=A0A2P2R4Y2_RHIMU